LEASILTDFYLYKGCLIPTRLPYLERASIDALDHMGIIHDPLPDATCCVEPIGLRTMAMDTWKVGAARMMAIAERDGRDIISLCNGCFMSFKEAEHLLNDGTERDRVNEILSDMGLEYRGRTRVRHLVEIARDMGRDRLSSLVTDPPKDLRIAVHPGCHLIRPSEILGVDSSFAPRALSDVAEWLGGSVVHSPDWPGCCGGGLAGIDDQISDRILEETVGEFREAGAEQILTPCPFCFVQFDVRQRNGIPVLYLGELMSIAFGQDRENLLRHHRTKFGD
jgi:heterodisulfide reductase subunit B